MFLQNDVVYGRGTVTSPHGTPVLDAPSVGVDMDGLGIYTKGTQAGGSHSAKASQAGALYAGFFGDYFNKVYIVPGVLSLIDPILGTPVPFNFWNTNFNDGTVTGVTGENSVGLTINANYPLTIGGLKLTPAAITVDDSAPDSEEAIFTFGLGGGLTTKWTVELLRTNLLNIAVEAPLIETLKWKTDVLGSKEGQEQRIGLAQFVRVEQTLKYVITDDADQKNIFEQFFALSNGSFSLPLWMEQTRLEGNVTAGTATVLIDVTKFDLQVGDQILLSKSDESVQESVKVDFINPDNVTVTLLSVLANDWTTDDLIFRVTTALLPAKPEIDRGNYGYLEISAVARIQEFRTLFSANAAPVELVKATVVQDRVLSTTVYTLSGIPILHARPIVDEKVKETFDWDIEVIDFDIGAFEYFTDRQLSSPSYDRKFYIKNLTQKFYWNWVLEWMHGQRRPVWLPTWVNDLGPDVVTIGGATITTNSEKFFTYYGAQGLQSVQGMWFTHPNGWFARRITAISRDGLGHTLIQLDEAVPDDFPVSGPYELGLLILARQAVDEVTREWHPLYSFLSTSFIGTKSTPEIT